MKDTIVEAKTVRTENVLFSKNKKQIKTIYEEAFTKAERMPFVLMLLMSCLPTTHFFAFYDGDTLCGMIYMGKLFRQAFVMFFAVDEKLRSKGYGGEILKELKVRYPKCCIVLSIEPCVEDAPDLALRRRRKSFYMRNGFQDSGYSIKLSGIWQEVLFSGKDFSRIRFSVFLIVYSCLAILPIMRKRSENA